MDINGMIWSMDITTAIEEDLGTEPYGGPAASPKNRQNFHPIFRHVQEL